MTWEIVIGLEVHAQLQTQTKIFSCESTRFGQAPNAQVGEVSAGLPGVLPVLNAEVVRLAARVGMALGCEVHPWSQFARKNYFYPDLPKGYQISQYKDPICTGGQIEYLLDGQPKVCRLTRIHIEEDAGKSNHGGRHSLLDLNRAGVPLVEIVTEPDLRSAEEAAACFRELRDILRTVGACDGNMEEGSLRCDANVSLRRAGGPLGTRAEVKNLNSFRFVQKAIEYEVVRQRDVLEAGQRVVQETRLFNADTGRTFTMRSKEDAHDYRYFPDPDLPPLVLEASWLEEQRAAMPELPAQRRARYTSRWGLSLDDASLLAQSKVVGDYFDQACAGTQAGKTVANWVINDVLREAGGEEGLEGLRFGPGHVGELAELIERGDLTSKLAKTVFAAMLQDGRRPSEVAQAEGLLPIRDEGELTRLVLAIKGEFPKQSEQLQGGKDSLMGFFVGQMMSRTGGKADPKLTRELILRHIKGET
jgi:aspartyl-tRNA(Asn)/glutamyl-tRNA(Gln) amidotransferase subunit B